MLIAPIDHNREPEPEKHVSKIKSPYWTLPTNGGLGAPQVKGTPHNSEGTILRVRDTRLMERRKSPSDAREQERRIKNNRQNGSRWNTASHHILVIAIERKAGEPELWKTGEHVSIVAKTQTITPTEAAQSPETKEKSKPPLLTKDEGDYVLHLSTHYPYER